MGKARPVLDAALAYLQAGRSVVPIAPGCKVPSVLRPTTGAPVRLRWKRYQETPATTAAVRRWFRGKDPVGIGIIAGPVSGTTLEGGTPAALEFLDFDNLDTYTCFVEFAESRGHGPLLGGLPCEETPRDGRHLGYLCAQWAGNTKLAQRRTGVDAKGRAIITTLIETRGAGGQCVVAPTPPGIHPDAPARGYVTLRGSWENIPVITSEAREALWECARALNEYVAEEVFRVAPPAAGMPAGSHPGDDFNRRVTPERVLELLTRRNWVVTHRRNGTAYLRRPGKAGDGWSATLGHVAPNVLYVFSSNAVPFEMERAYDPFGIYARLEHCGDFQAAAKALAAEGYGAHTGGTRRETSEATVCSSIVDRNGQATGGAPAADIPVIRLGADMTAAVDGLQEALLVLPRGPHLYQRARQLCVIARGVTPPRWLRRPPETPVIAPVMPPFLRELAGRAASWERYDKRQRAWGVTMPPVWVVDTLLARPAWPFPPLEGVVCAPTLRPDGSLLTTPGYDPETGLYLDLSGASYPALRGRPTLDDARTAVGRLQQVFVDFPFAASHHFSTVLAAVLSLVARHAVQGNVPLYAVRSTTRGSGKGLLVDTVSVIATGRPAPRWAHTRNEDEERKRLLTIAMAGDALIHIDNVTHPLGSAPLDLALTAPTVADRLLGRQQRCEAPMQAVFFASGNNMVFRGDMARRVVPVDLDPQVERPEERETFTHAPLLPWVLQERPTLVVAALTILRAYFVAGRPSQGVKPLGSFEEWSTIVRQALIWAGEVDPCDGRMDIEAESDQDYEALHTLLEAWYACYGTRNRTLKQVVADIRRHTQAGSASGEWDELRDALGSLDANDTGQGLNTRVIGEALRAWRGRLIGGKRFMRVGTDRKGVAEWRIEGLPG
jgi:hypothetical protein